MDTFFVLVILQVNSVVSVKCKIQHCIMIFTDIKSPSHSAVISVCEFPVSYQLQEFVVVTAINYDQKFLITSQLLSTAQNFMHVFSHHILIQLTHLMVCRHCIRFCDTFWLAMGHYIKIQGFNQCFLVFLLLC